MVTQQEVLEYARECKRQRPQITGDALRTVLEARFIRGANPLAAGAGAVANPLDWLIGLIRVVRGIRRLWSSSGQDVRGVEDIIEGVLRIVLEEPVGPSP
jgi:hypothetical protein